MTIDIVFGLLPMLIHVCGSLSEESSCCTLLPIHTHCRRACRQLYSSVSVTDQLDSFIRISDICHRQSDVFWACANSSSPVLKDVDRWPGRICCDEAILPQCAQACRKATSLHGIQKVCQKNEEIILYACLQKLSESSACCRRGVTPSCRTMCHYLAYSGYAIPSHQQVLQQVCASNKPSVLRCGRHDTINWTQASQPYHHRSRKGLPCCKKALTSKCKKTCLRVLVSMSEQDALDEMIRRCGNIIPSEPMWDCFLTTSASSKSTRHDPDGHKKFLRKISIYGAKLHCCSRAVSTVCHDLCVGVYSRDWNDQWQQFEAKCLSYDLTSRRETAMQSCLADLEEPCKAGCKGLTFCSNFNHRPSEMFRGCNAKADITAHDQFKTWKSGVITLPQLTLSVNDIMKCEPEMWKAIACTIHVKPCHSHDVPVTICRSDCLYILTKCVRLDQLPSGQTITSLCEALSPSDNLSSCVTINRYTERSPPIDDSHVTFPCQSQPCADGEVCLVNRHKCKHEKTCHPYTCKRGESPVMKSCHQKHNCLTITLIAIPIYRL